MLTAKDLVCHHGAQVVLGGVSLSVTAGTRLGVVGPNGIGKSTLLRILAGIEAPDGGVVARYLPPRPSGGSHRNQTPIVGRRCVPTSRAAPAWRLPARC